jgi:co-chaperonin GroES (HSP10)
MSLRILLHHVLVKLDDATEADDVYRKAKAAGIELALDKREQKAVEYGTVVQVGPTAFLDYGRDPDILKGGDRVSFARYSGKDVTDSNGDKYVLLNDSDILVVVE